MVWRSTVALWGLAAAVGTVRAQQAPEPGEVHVSSGEYRPRPRFTLRVDTRLVEVGVVVRDRRGRTVAGLTKDAFEVTDEGKKRPIAAFAVETSIPAPAAAPSGEPGPAAPPKVSQRYVGLLFDDLSMGPGELPQAQAAARRFVKDGLTRGDHAAVLTTSGMQNLPFTTEVAKLVEAIGRLHINSRIPSGGMCPSMTPYDAYGIANRIDLAAFNNKLSEAARCAGQPTPADVTSFEGETMRSSGRQRSAPPPSRQIIQQVKAQASSIWEQVRQTSRNTLGAIEDVVDYMAQMPGNRMVLLASSGFLSGTLEPELDEIARHALHAGVVINALDAKGLYADDPVVATGGADARSITRMQLSGSIAKEAANDAVASLAYNTGGLFFHNNNDLDLGFRELGVRPEVSYLLGISPDQVPDGKYHKLKVRLTAPSRYSVQARLGYMAVQQAPAPPQPERRIDTEAMAADTLEEVPAAISTVLAQTDAGEPAIRAVFHLDIQRLPFREEAGVRRQTISLIALLTDADGVFVAAKEGSVVLALQGPTYNMLCEKGLNATITLAAPAGAYRLRAVVQEGLEGKVSAVTQAVEIR